MQGWIKFHRKILDNEIWHDVTAFRLFTLLLLKASHKDGVKTRGIEIDRGQYLRSYSKLSEDLEYMEGRSRKKIPKSTIERKVKKLIDEGMVSVSETVSGTLFTILKYDSYQGFEEESKEDGGTVEEAIAGQTRDDSGTDAGQEQELKNLRTKELNSTTATTTAPAPLVEEEFAKVIQTFEANLCALSPIQIDSLEMWFNDFKRDDQIIFEAVRISADRNKKSFGFFANLLKEWSNNKLATLDQIKSYERNKFNKQSVQKNTGTYQPRSNYGNKPMREELLPEWFGKPDEEPVKATVPTSREELEAEKQKLLAELYAKKAKKE